MQMLNQYEEVANKFCEESGIEFSVFLVGNDCPRFCNDARKGIDMNKVNQFPRQTHIHGKHYRYTLRKSGQVSKELTGDFWNSYNDEEDNWWQIEGKYYSWKTSDRGINALKQRHGRASGITQKPTAYSVFSCLTTSEPGMFEEFCSDYGYDTDSRRAEETWRAVMDEWIKVRRFFTANELIKLQEIN